MKNFRIFWWAMLHHPEFRYCLIQLPIDLRGGWGKKIWFQIELRSLSIYIPYKVRNAYYRATQSESDFEDIPF